MQTEIQFQATNNKCQAGNKLIRGRHFPEKVINFIAVQPFCRCLVTFFSTVDMRLITQAVAEYHSAPYV